MKTQVSELAENRVRLEIEVSAHDVDHAFEHALHDLSAGVRVPGFRKGKAPAAMVARQVGRDAVVEEALREHMTSWYSRAVAEAGIDPVERPTYDWSDDLTEGETFSFTAEVAVKPPPKVGKYKGLDAVRRPVEVPQEAVDAEIERLRLTVAELTPVERPAEAEDFVTIDYQGSVSDSPAEGGSDYGVQLGEGRLLPELESGIIGMSAGEKKDIDFQIPQQDGLPVPARFEVTLKDVKQRDLPALDDDLATSVSEFDTLAELRDDITNTIREGMTAESDGYLRATVLDSLAQELSTPVPEVLVSVRVREMVRRMVRDLEARGIDADQYLAATGQSSEQLVAMFTAEATDSVRKDLALEAVVDAEGIEVSDEMVEEWVRGQAVETGEEADAAVERLMGDPAILTSLRTDLKMQKALDIVAESANEITPDQASARERLWTPEKDSPPAGEKPTEIWTPGSAQPADR